MKKEILIALIVIVILSGFASAECEPSVVMLNQDPYPAVPGEYVKVVFQINGTETTDCESIYFDIVPEYPFSIESSDTREVILGGTYVSGYPSFVLKAYKLVVDENALDGDQKLKVSYGYVSDDGSRADLTKKFDVNVKDARTDFEVSIQDYDSATNTVTFGIINVGKYDIESLTLDVPEQDNIRMIGGNPAIIGSLSSNDDTTANVIAVPKVGELQVKLIYNDQNDVRRTVEKSVYFSQNLIENGKVVQQPKGVYYYLFWGLLVFLVLYMAYGYYQRRKVKSSKLALLRR
jgi:hypothetical protein